MDLVSRPKMETIAESDVVVAIYKYKQMMKLVEIFERHENTYKEKLEKHGKAVIKEVHGRINAQNLKMEKCLKQGNQLEKQEI